MLILFLFMLIGYLEAGFVGVFAGFLFWAVCNLFQLVGLVPFIGYFLFQWLIEPFTTNICKFLHLPVLMEKLWLFYGVVALIYCMLTSIATVIIVSLAIYYWKKRRNISESLIFEENLKEFEEFIKMLDWKNIKLLINEIQLKLKELEKKVNKKLIGSVLYWLGIGVASHDFWWECEEYKVDSERPTHGVYVGLGLATTGANVIESGFFNNLIHYLGLGLTIIAFNLLSFLPKGPSRWTAHIFWWSGVTLMTYNWYIKMKTEIVAESQSQKEYETIMEMINNVRKRN